MLKVAHGTIYADKELLFLIVYAIVWLADIAFLDKVKSTQER